MPEVLIQSIKPSDWRNNGVIIINFAKILKIITFNVIVSQAVAIPPGKVGGNHRHPRTKSFICFDSSATFHWIDSLGDHHEQIMVDEAKGLNLVTVYPGVPHAIKNNSQHLITVLEFANAKQHDVEMVQVV